MSELPPPVGRNLRPTPCFRYSWGFHGGRGATRVYIDEKLGLVLQVDTRCNAVSRMGGKETKSYWLRADCKGYGSPPEDLVFDTLDEVLDRWAEVTS
jgi:hypothetical protein